MWGISCLAVSSTKQFENTGREAVCTGSDQGKRSPYLEAGE